MKKVFEFRKLLFSIQKISTGTYRVFVQSSRKELSFTTHNSIAYDNCDDDRILVARDARRSLYNQYRYLTNA